MLSMKSIGKKTCQYAANRNVIPDI